MRDDLKVLKVEKIKKVGNHHEYRGNPLPAYAIFYDHPQDIVAYVDAKSGIFQKVRYSSWRIFDFLWMGHIMDYQGRDNFNNLLLRIFSLFGIFTVVSVGRRNSSLTCNSKPIFSNEFQSDFAFFLCLSHEISNPSSANNLSASLIPKFMFTGAV